jgi:hypothetical protein
MTKRGAEGWAHLEQELVAERAWALRRIAERLEELLAGLEAAHREPAPPEEERPARAAAYAATHREARRYRLYLEIQREAIGLRQHQVLDELYKVPGPCPF